MLRTRRNSANYKNQVIKTLKNKYSLLFLGIIVVLASLFISILALTKNKSIKITKIIPTTTSQQESVKAETKKYVVKAGDFLWKIAEEAYGSGYNAYDIATANKIADPNLIEPGQTLILPVVAAKTPTKGEIASAATSSKVVFSGDKYTVKTGDYLWKIALETYGDGYAWVRIAKGNNLANPNFIHKGNILLIPRN